jgi:hypothetical protein
MRYNVFMNNDMLEKAKEKYREWYRGEYHHSKANWHSPTVSGYDLEYKEEIRHCGGDNEMIRDIEREVEANWSKLVYERSMTT